MRNNVLNFYKRAMSKVNPRPLCNYLFNYPQYEKDMDSKLPSYWEKDNKEYQKDFESIRSQQMSYALKTNWVESVNKEDNTSCLMRQFKFINNQSLSQFVNSMKEKCDELDHHPEWAISPNNVLQVKLTSHFKKNNISTKDYQLAAEMSLVYESVENNLLMTYPQYRKIVSFAFGAAVAILLTSVAAYWYHTSNHYSITSRDFLFTKINNRHNNFKEQNRY